MLASTMFHLFTLLIVQSIVKNSAAVVTFEPSNYKLELLQVLFRHGDRIIELNESYPNDPYHSIYKIYGYGQLTNKGKKQEFKLGTMLRERYGNFLGEDYKREYVYAYSTDTDRTKMSLQLVLAGIYTPISKPWNKNINWTPIPTNYNVRKFDFLLTSEQCHEFGKLFDQITASPEIQTKLREYKNLIQYLSNNTGLIAEPSSGSFLYHNIRALLSLELPLPHWCTKEIYQKLEEIAAIKFDLYAHTNAMKKLSAGPAIKRFLKNIDDNEIKRNGKKLYLYSAHDSNLVPFIRAHNLTHPRTADYGSALIVEKLRGNDTRVYIRLLFWTGVGEKLKVLKLKNCEEICPLTDYVKIIAPSLPANEGTECLYKNARVNVENLIKGTISSEAVNSCLLKYVD